MYYCFWGETLYLHYFIIFILSMLLVYLKIFLCLWFSSMADPSHFKHIPEMVLVILYEQQDEDDEIVLSPDSGTQMCRCHFCEACKHWLGNLRCPWNLVIVFIHFILFCQQNLISCATGKQFSVIGYLQYFTCDK